MPLKITVVKKVIHNDLVDEYLQIADRGTAFNLSVSVSCLACSRHPSVV